VTQRPADGGRHVPTSVPGAAGPSDLSGTLNRIRAQNDVGATPAGGYPTTVGGNPNAPADRQTSDSGGQVAQAPGTDATAWSDATKFNPQGITGAIY
jgi:hypothetical protein